MSSVKGSTEIVLFQNPDKTVVLITEEQCSLALKLIKEYNSSLAAQTRKELNDSGKIFTIYVFSGAGIGFAVGGTVGLITGPGALVTVPACAAVGSLIGTLVGTCIGVYKAYLSNNSQWVTWREKQTRETMKAFLAIFQDNFEDGALEKLNIVDEYDYSIMDNPCVDHCTSAQTIGHVHNFSSWQSMAKAGRKCAGIEDIDLEKLKPYYPSLGKLAQMCAFLLKNLKTITLPKGEPLPQFFVVGIHTLHDSVNSRIQRYWDLSKEHIAGLQRSGKISRRLEADYLRMLAIMMEPEDTLPLKSTKIDSSSSNSLTTTTNSLSLEAPKEQNQNSNTTTNKSGD